MNDQLLNDLNEFCRSDCDRYDFLINWLTREEITHSVIPTGEARHILIRLDKVRPYLKRYYVKTLVAHYDRVPGTPGANDNSAAVMQLLHSINALRNLKFAHNVQIVLTDKEELGPDQSITSQGAFQLARLFREKNINNCIFFVFDMCGIGDTLIYGQTGLQLLKSKEEKDRRYSRIVKHMEQFSTALSNLFLEFRTGEFFNINLLFSDDLGLLLNRYPSVQLSVLHYEEAINVKRSLISLNEEQWQYIYDKGMLSAEYQDFISRNMPPSWRNNHSGSDSIETLTESAFTLIRDFIMELAGFQIPFGDVES
ncbi:MAG: M28 family peptidase [Calditrichaeota bacterium]|nr:MAG: M28 family peptidase [Calditrichota bacterium]